MQPDQIKQSLRQLAAEAAELKAVAGGALTDVIADWVAPQYAVAAREQLANAANAEERWKVLRMVTNDLAALRRGDNSAARLQLDREEFEWQRANRKSQKEQEFREWLQRPEVQEEFFPERTRGLSPETIRKIETELRLL